MGLSSYGKPKYFEKILNNVFIKDKNLELNLKYFNQTLNKLSNKFIINLQTFDHYNNSPLNKNNHYILSLVRKWKKLTVFLYFIHYAAF